MHNKIFVKNYPEMPFDRKEILRYMGVRTENDEISALLDECICEASGKFAYRVCYGEFGVTYGENITDLTFAKYKSEALRKYLKGAKNIILFAATVGLETDRLIKRYGGVAPSKAVVFQAIGTERIESLCDCFCAEAEKVCSGKKLFCGTRFSPGYGDIPLHMQRDIFNVLDCGRKIGLSLNESLFMTPTKSVTAIIPVLEKSCKRTAKSCDDCLQTNCQFRKD